MSTVHFGAFELIVHERVLRRGNEHCLIGARAFDVLVALVERRERVVSKAELLDVAWDGLVVEENNLSIQISALRRVLGQHAISTIPGRGYRFTFSCAAGTVPPVTQVNRPGRRLAAVLAAQPEQADGVTTVDWTHAYLHVVEPFLSAAGGHAQLRSNGSCLATLDSAVDALHVALDLQQRLSSNGQDIRAAQPRLRIAVLVDDAFLADPAPLDKVPPRVTALLECARANEVVTDRIVRQLARGDTAFHFEPVRPAQCTTQDAMAEDVFRVVLAATSATAQHGRPAITSHYQPRVAVLPFACDGNESEGYFGDGISEEIITHLALNRHLFVIARGSTLRYRDRQQSTAEIAQELGVRYLLDGSVRRQGARLRIAAEFSDCHLGRVIWADSFEGRHAELFDLQERIAVRIAGAIDPCVREAELAQVRLRPTESLDAYDCVLRGLHLQYLEEEHAFERAGGYFRQAVALDPGYAQAHSHLAWWLTMCIGEGRTPLSVELRQRAIEHARRAVEVDPRDAWALSIAGHTYAFLQKQFSIALDMFQQALTINPNSAIAWARSATTLAYLGRGEEATERVRNALELSPFDQFAFSFCTTHGLASLTCSKFDEAVWWLEKARRLNPRYRAAERLLIAAYSLCGNTDRAQAMALDFLRIEPEFRVGSFGDWYPLQSPHRERLLQGLRSAGLPA